MYTPKFHPKVIWFTGLSGSGKTTLSTKLHEHLLRSNVRSVVLDGDEIRKTLSKDLGFTEADRRENVRRVAEYAKKLLDSGSVVLIALISPFEVDRAMAKEIIGRSDFVEVYIDCPLSVCALRDVKGLYEKAKLGVLKNFTGISSPYEVPTSPDIVVRTDRSSVDECLTELIEFLIPKEQVDPTES